MHKRHTDRQTDTHTDTQTYIAFYIYRQSYMTKNHCSPTERDGAAIERDGAAIERDDACGVVGQTCLLIRSKF